MQKQQPELAVASFKDAISEEDQLVYREPPDWFLPSRQFLGAALMKLNKIKEAEEVYKKDLKFNQANGWSLLGMYNTLVAQNKKKEAAIFKNKYKEAFKYADVYPTSSVF